MGVQRGLLHGDGGGHVSTRARHAHPHPLLCIGSSACLPECGQRYESSCHCPCLKRLIFICHFVACRFSFSFLKHRVNGLPEARREDPGPPRCPEGGAHLCFSGSSLLVHARVTQQGQAHRCLQPTFRAGRAQTGVPLPRPGQDSGLHRVNGVNGMNSLRASPGPRTPWC